jgi:integrase
MLQNCVGRVFPAIVTDVDDRGVRMQLRDLPVVARVAAQGVRPGDALAVRLDAVDIDRRAITFSVTPQTPPA